jgi:RNA recognition motif-containing protein
MPPPDRFRDDNYPYPPPEHFGGRNAPSDRNPRGGRRNDETIGLSLLVRNISADITSEEIRQAFGRIGHVRDVYMCV